MERNADSTGVAPKSTNENLPVGFALEARRRIIPAGTAAIERSLLTFAEAAGRRRLGSIDLLRGLVMIVMALDHTRDFFATGTFNPRDVTAPALFLTRWITHFCAPTFILLAGISAFLYGARRSTGEIRRYLLTRGCWLVLIEFTVVRFCWTFSFDFDHLTLQVIFAIGASMIVLAALVHLPRWAIATIGLAMIATHNMYDGIRAEQLGAAAPFWALLHQRAVLELMPGFKLIVLYPLIPWIGVMAAGYALGPLFTRERSVRVQRLLVLAAVVTLGFVLLRATNLYGDPARWALQNGALSTTLSFINCEKYPPSLLYLAMAIGPALLLLAAFDGAQGRIVGWTATFGRVPLFYYVAHLFLIHTLAVLFAWTATGSAVLSAAHKPAGYGLGLAGTYAVWLTVVISLFPVCRWFAAIKQRRNAWWLNYL